MDTLTRRRFLLASGVVGGGAIVAGAAGMTMAELLGTAGTERPEWMERTVNRVVLVTLYGGNDGLNTVIPYADPVYHAARPELAYGPGQVLHLSGSLGLNPGLTGLKGLWDKKNLAIVLGVGYPKPNRSHFRSMDIWQTGAPATVVNTGWVGRWLDGTKAPREAAVSFEPVLPPMLAGTSHTGSCVSYRGLTLPRWIDERTVAALGHADPKESAMRGHAAAAYADLVRLGPALGDDHSSPGALPTPDTPVTGTGGQSVLAAQLTQVARCVEAGVPTQVFSVSLGGFDSHAEERPGHDALLRQLDQALTAFLARMAKTEAGQRVAVIVYSEFGRRVRANASDGTDHGTAGPLFVLGPRVAGGFYGTQPSLTDLDDGDLKATTDFRDVFGTVLASVLHADPARYLDGYQPHLLPLFTIPR
jgi:uncharacterized protein (DUF1501 family)